MVARALARLDVGELAVLSFGEGAGPESGGRRVRTLHPLGVPFSDASGPGVVSRFTFDRDNTLADTPMVSLLEELEATLDEAAGGGGTCQHQQQLHQLVLVMSDGRFHEKEPLRRAVRRLAERPGLLLAFIVLDDPRRSLLDLQTVSFAPQPGGAAGPTFSRYLDTFPFPYYALVRELARLPAALADLLKQFFELSAAGLA